MTYPKISFKIKKTIKDFLIAMIVLIQLESCSKKPKNTEISNARVSIKKPKTKKKIPITFTVDAKKIKEKGDLNMTVDIIEGEGEVDLANSTIRIKDDNKIEKTFYYTPNTPGNHKLSINANGLGVELNEDISINVSDEIIDTNFTIKVTKKKYYPGDKVQISIHTKEKNHDRLIINAKSKSNNGKLIEERNTCISYYFIADKPGDYEIE